MLNVSAFKTKVTPKLHGTSLAKVGDIYGKLHEASGNLFSHVRPYTVIRKARINNAIYDHIYNYTCEDDLEVDSVIDIRPIGPRSSNDSVLGATTKDFDIKKVENTFAVEYVNGVKTLRLSKCLAPTLSLLTGENISDGVTVTPSEDASNVRLDYLDFISGRSSIAFDLSGATGVGQLDIVLDNPVNLGALMGQGSILPWFKFPVASKLTSVRVRIGSSSSVYYEKVIGAALNSAFIDDQWMALLQNIETSAKVGIPNMGAINYIQIFVTYAVGTAYTARLDNITASLGQAWEVVYYSNRLFTDLTGLTWKEIPTADTDLIRLEGALDNNAFMYEFMLTLQQEIKGKNMAADYAYFASQLNGNPKTGSAGIYAALEEKYPAQAIERISTYYEFDSEYADQDNDNYAMGQAAQMPASAGNTFESQQVTVVQDGDNVTLDLSQLNFNFETIQFVSMNGTIVYPGAGDPFVSQWTRAGNIITITHADAASIYYVFYTH